MEHRQETRDVSHYFHCSMTRRTFDSVVPTLEGTHQCFVVIYWSDDCLALELDQRIFVEFRFETTVDVDDTGYKIEECTDVLGDMGCDDIEHIRIEYI